MALVISLQINSSAVKAQKSVSIEGRIASNDSIPVSNASVVLLGLDSPVRYFCISKANGRFTIKLKIEKPGDYRLQVSHIGFRTTELMIVFTKDLNDHPDIYVEMSPATVELKEVVINSRLPSISVRHDTIEFDAKSFRNPETVKLVDLLKNISGFNIDNNGRISYNGKQIEKILIEGDDLAGRNYKLISNYLGAVVIDKVQVLSNYSDNRLLKDMERSGKVAINLKIDDKMKNKLSGTLEYGGSPNGHQTASENLIHLDKKLKSLLFANNNNTGDPVNGDIQYHFNDDQQQSAESDDSHQYEGVVKEANIQAPGLNDKYVKRNNDAGYNLMNSWKMGKFVKIRTLAGYGSQSLENSDAGFDETILSALSKWTISSLDKSRWKANDLYVETAMTHDNMKRNIGTYDLSIAGRRDYSNYHSLVSGAVVDTLEESLQNNFREMHFSGSETFVCKKNTVLVVEMEFNKRDVLQDFNSSTNRLLKYFLLDSLYSINVQKTKQYFQSGGITVKESLKKGSLSCSYGLSTSFSLSNISNQVVNENRNDKTERVYQPASKSGFSENRSGAFAKADIKFKNSMLSAGISLGYGRVNWTDGYRIKLNRFLPKAYIEYKHNISVFKNITLGYEFAYAEPLPRYFYGSGFLSGNAMISDGASIISMRKSGKLSISYTSNNFFSSNQLLISGSFSNSSGDYHTGSYLRPEFTITKMIPANHDYNAAININFQRYFSSLHGKFNLLVQYTRAKMGIFLNDLYSNNVFSVVRVQMKYVSAFKMPVNIESSYSATFINNYMHSTNQINDRHNLWQYEGYGKIKAELSKKIYSNLVYGYYIFSPHNMFRSLDAFITYLHDQKWTFSLNMHNLLNGKSLVRENISVTNIDVYAFNLVGRYVLGKIAYNL